MLDRQGHIVRSFGKGLISVAHNIKIDSQGNVWTTNAGNSKVIKFSPDGKELMEFVLGDSPTVASGGCAYLANPSNGYMDFCGTTDIVVTPEGRIFVTDGYGKKRVLEYSAAGDKRIREWGGSGTEPGKFMLPHGLAYDGKGVLFVTDREGGRIERFDTKGTYIGEWTLGNAGSIAYARGALWAVIAVPAAELQSGEKPKRSSFVIRIDPVTGKDYRQAGHNRTRRHIGNRLHRCKRKRRGSRRSNTRRLRPIQPGALIRGRGTQGPK